MTNNQSRSKAMRFKHSASNIGGIAATVGIALTVAACGSGGGAYGSAAPSANSKAPVSSGAPLTIGTASGSLGTYLTGASGRALYLFAADSTGRSSCTGACASAWPPVTVSATPHASGGAAAGDLATIKRSDGALQVTYKGHPLYYFSGDPRSGSTTGEG